VHIAEVGLRSLSLAIFSEAWSEAEAPTAAKTSLDGTETQRLWPYRIVLFRDCMMRECCRVHLERTTIVSWGLRTLQVVSCGISGAYLQNIVLT